MKRKYKNRKARKRQEGKEEGKMKLPRKSMEKMGEKWEGSQSREKQRGDGKMSKGKKKYTWKAFGKKWRRKGEET